jgi:hypothetical protein
MSKPIRNERFRSILADPTLLLENQNSLLVQAISKRGQIEEKFCRGSLTALMWLSPSATVHRL